MATSDPYDDPRNWPDITDPDGTRYTFERFHPTD